MATMPALPTQILYVVKMENDEYLQLNPVATGEDDIFLTTSDIAEATYVDDDQLQDIKTVIRTYGKRLFIFNHRNYIKPAEVLHFHLVPTGVSNIWEGVK